MRGRLLGLCPLSHLPLSLRQALSTGNWSSFYPCTQWGCNTPCWAVVKHFSAAVQLLSHSSWLFSFAAAQQSVAVRTLGVTCQFLQNYHPPEGNDESPQVLCEQERSLDR